MTTAPPLESAETGTDYPKRRPPFNSPADTSAAFRIAFGVPFSILDATTGDLLYLAVGQPARDWTVRGELAREVGRRGHPEFIEEAGPLVTLAVPVATERSTDYVAMATLLAEPFLDTPAQLQAAAGLLGLDRDDARSWIALQSPCPAKVLRKIAVLMQEKFETGRRLARLERESATGAQQVSATQDEINLLYCLIHNLRISPDDDQLARLALEWLGNVVPSRGLALLWCGTELNRTGGVGDVVRAGFVSRGQCPVDQQELVGLVNQCGLTVESGAYLANPPVTAGLNWPQSGIQSLIVVPVASGGKLYGWLAAFNRNRADGFRQADANLFGSVATILGIHRENTELFHDQTEFVSGIVHALTSAIDAKDPYTCGHSDRVARMAVRLGKELGCGRDELKTLYLAGLLHDIGKIGVDDEILHKEDELTVEEFAHIKRHSRMGCKILADLKQIKHVLPVVLHHHEAWDGSGYPTGLSGREIPRLARILAVADAFDAMASNRRYRSGMTIDELEAIFRRESGKRWDPEVVSAYFNVRNDLIAMLQTSSHPLPISIPGWT